jgi:hypothetical protein
MGSSRPAGTLPAKFWWLFVLLVGSSIFTVIFALSGLMPKSVLNLKFFSKSERD